MKRNTVSPVSLGTDRLAVLLPRYAIPAIIAMTSASLYNIIDSIFIGHGVGALAISGLALTMPLMNLASAFGSMVGIGASALVSIRLGQGNKQGAERILGNVVLLNICIGLTFGIVGLTFLDPILYFFGASEQTIGYSRDFMQIILAGNVITHLYLGLNDSLRASGYPRKSMFVMLTAVAVNCCLNPLFIFGFGWGIRGSAIATVIAQFTAFSILIHHFSSPDSFLRFRRGIFRLRRKIVGGILSIGLAPFLVNACASVVVIFINTALKNNGGDLYIGAYGIINRIVMLFVMIIMGLNQGMQPIVGYNYGARQYDRVVKVLKMTIGCAVCITTAGFLVSRLFPHAAVQLFVDSESGADAAQLIDVAANGLTVILTMFPFVGFQIVTGNFFQYIGKPKRAILLSLTRQLLFLLPLLSILPDRFGARGVWMSMPIADTFSVMLAAVLLCFQLRKFRRSPDSERSI